MNSSDELCGDMLDLGGQGVNGYPLTPRCRSKKNLSDANVVWRGTVLDFMRDRDRPYRPGIIYVYDDHNYFCYPMWDCPDVTADGVKKFSRTLQCTIELYDTRDAILHIPQSMSRKCDDEDLVRAYMKFFLFSDGGCREQDFDRWFIESYK